jgi:hypothetical protein
MRDYLFRSDEDGGWIAEILDLFACAAFGEMPEEAFRGADRQAGVAGLCPSGRQAHSGAAIPTRNSSNRLTLIGISDGAARFHAVLPAVPRLRNQPYALTFC